ncbi:hypothetical protein [Formosa haliotis]|uniref:hypothetical protein n=1 Tax=Formosa haliotis TaxID=1555194 RepID=UPI000826B99C|nr:hypothetical protein [Formosa haliotis]
MKKTLLYVLLIAFSLSSYTIKAQVEAGDVGKIWSYPVIYNYNEETTWYFDLVNTSFAEAQDLYIWIWSPSEPDAGNWENSSDFAKLKYEGDMVWSFTLTPTDYFSVSADDIAASAGFWFRLKDKTGSMQSSVSQVPYTPFDSFYSANEMIRSYPEKPTLTSGLSILFNANLVDGFEGVSSVHFHSGLNDWEVLQEYQAWVPEVVEKTKLKDLGNGFYRMDLIPSEYYGTQEGYYDGYIMEKINFLMVAKDWVANSGDQVLLAAEYVQPPDPEFRFFPLNISQKDFLGMSRINNERGVTMLKYKITAGPKVITGEFSGGTSEIKGFVDLVSELYGITGLTQIHVMVTDNNDRLISDTVMPLKNVE